jgi:hypothetical protein
MPTRRRNQLFATLLSVFLLAGLGFGLGAWAGEGEVDWSSGKYTGSEEEVLTLMAFYDSIQLTAEQEAVRQEALGPLPAACCNEFSMATCCCECNLSRSIWGLSKHLIAERGADAEQVRGAVQAWVATINPGGYEGKTCMTGQCGKPFKEDGCGGMNKHHLVH